MIKAESLIYQYPGHVAIKFPDFELKSGEQMLILGQSGSGKTTLLHCLAGLRKPNSGMVQVGTTNLVSLSKAELDKFRGNEIGVIFQRPHFLQSLSVRENFELLRAIHPQKIESTFIARLLERLGLAHRQKAYQWQLSEGEKQRVSIGLAICHKPSLLLADEPTSSLDDLHCEEVIALIKEQASSVGTTLITVTHDQRLKRHFDRQLLLLPPTQ